MIDVYRIQDRFYITGRGFICLLSHPKEAIINIHDLFYDLHGNRFRVKGIEMIKKINLDTNDWDGLPTGVMFEVIDGVEMVGNILVREMCDINFLFCNHPLHLGRVDEDYELECQFLRNIEFLYLQVKFLLLMSIGQINMMLKYRAKNIGGLILSQENLAVISSQLILPENKMENSLLWN